MMMPRFHFFATAIHPKWRVSSCTKIAMLCALCSMSIQAQLLSSPASFGDGRACLIFDLLERSPHRNEPVYAELGWTSAVLWGAGGNLLLLDNAFNRLLTAPLDRPPAAAGLVEPTKTLRHSDTKRAYEVGYLKYAYPTSNGSFLLFDRDANILFGVNADFTVNEDRQIRTDRLLDDSSLKLLTLYRFASVGQGVLAFADFEETAARSRTDQYFSSFVLLGFDGSYQLLGNRIPPWADLRYRLLRDFSYISSMDGIGWVLMMADEPFVARVEWNDNPQLEKLTGFSAGEFSRLPAIRWHYDARESFLKKVIPHPLEVMTQAFEFYVDIEGASVLSGIHVWKDRLLLVAKEGVDKRGRTRTWLLEISPEDGEILHRYQLPTSAESVLLAGDRFLALVEKGPIRQVASYPAFKLVRDALTVKRIDESFLAKKQVNVTESYCTRVVPAE